ncbi:MAG: radical SAM protein [Deltaproteobacteria bacterium]|nr:radical SAM protein [Deltaproteobacteria bacterium]
MKAVLHLTQACNLRCTYCYAPDKQVKKAMSLTTAKKAIDLVTGLGNGSACVSYFGGEPLLVWDTIETLTRHGREVGARLGKTMHFRLSTNGTLFDERKLRFCRENNMLFAISLDGDKEAHDAQRILPNGKGSFDLLDSKLDMILELCPHTVFTSVITPQSAARLSSSIEYMWGRGIRYMVHQLDYTHPDWDPDSLAVLEESYRQMAAFYLDKVRAGERFHLSVFDDKLKTHADSPIALGAICDFGSKKISVAPDGRLFPCVQFVSDREDAAAYCIGDVETGFYPRRDELVRLNRQERRQCDGCALLGRCSNYCGCMNWQVTGEITEVPGILCAHEQMLIPIADEVGNVLWDEKNAHFLQKHYKHFDSHFAYRFD